MLRANSAQFDRAVNSARSRFTGAMNAMQRSAMGWSRFAASVEERRGSVLRGHKKYAHPHGLFFGNNGNPVFSHGVSVLTYTLPTYLTHPFHQHGVFSIKSRMASYLIASFLGCVWCSSAPYTWPTSALL